MTQTTRSRATLFFCGVLAAMAVLTYPRFVGTNWGPLLGEGDTNLYEYTGFYALEHLSFRPFPSLDFHTDEIFFPFGINAAMQPWCVERDLFYVAATRLFGMGPWMQLYVWASYIVCAVGVFLLTKKDFGEVRAAVAALLASYFNFYAIQKFPHHLPLSTVHWMTISIAADFVIVRALARRESVGPRLALFRVALSFLVLGLELGYVAAFALLSAFCSGMFALGLAFRRPRARPVLVSLLGWLRTSARDLARTPLQTAGLVMLLLAGAGLYLPFVLQIVRAAKEIGSVGAQGQWWSNQLQLIVPYFPGVHPGSRLMESIFGTPEGVGEDSPGWLLLAIAGYGGWCAHRKKALAYYVPLAAFVLLALVYHPRHLRTLNVFPWLQFYRAAGRRTLLMPIALVLFGLEITLPEAEEKARKIVLTLASIGVVEMTVVYATPPRSKLTPVDAKLLAHMAKVRDTPGEAVLDWPFCVAGGNGVGTEQLCPFYRYEETLFTFRRFHRKKVVGALLARLTDRQIAPYVDAGYAHLFAPDAADAHLSTRQTRCFDEREWAFFTDLVTYGDVAGIQLYTDRLPPSCVEAFHARFGAPVSSAVLAGAGAVEFLRKPPALAGHTDSERLRALRLVDPLR